MGLVLLLGLLANADACESDSDCKGDRICEAGACVDADVPAVPATADDSAVMRVGSRYIIGEQSYSWRDLRASIETSGNADAIKYAHKSVQMQTAGYILVGVGAGALAFGVVGATVIEDYEDWPMALVGGGAFAITGTILLALAPNQREKAATAFAAGKAAFVVPQLRRDGGGLAVVGRF